MADDVVNPGDAANLNRLNRALEGAIADLHGELREARGLQTQAAEDRKETRRQAQRERAERRTATEAASTRQIQRAARSLPQTPAQTRLLPEALSTLADRVKAASTTAAAPVAPAQSAVQRAIDEARRTLQRTGGPLAVPIAPESIQRVATAVAAAEAQLPGHRTRMVVSSTPEGVRITAGAAPPPVPPQPPRPTAAAPDEPPRPPRSAYQLPGGGVSLAAASALDDEAEASRRAEQRAQTLIGAHRALSTSAAQLELSLAGESRQSQLAGDQMRRHGLLTTEFINAAARGRTTIRELGVQIGGTIAKFAGWTTAAALTYGGLAAVQQLGTGALDSLQGVNQLQRVVSNLDTTKAQQQFRSLADEFNLPISTVTDAAFEASKAFKDQEQILQATRAALQGVKVGELEAGASGKYATAIVRGFKLETSDLGRVLDVVNRLQNQFGGDFGQIFQGVAGAAGSFANARGTFEELAALIQTGQQVTGKTGNELATALRRSAEIVLRPERRGRIIDLLGIDPQDTSITDIIRAAQKKYAENPDPQLLQQLAVTISTPELASGRIAPLIRSGELFEQRLADVQANATGSAAKELARVKQSATEQIKELTNQLQELGSALAEVGAAGGLGVVVEAIDQAEEGTIKLVEALNLIPKPLREAALAAAPFLGALALLRRFDAGQLLAGRTGALGVLGSQLSRNPRARGRAQLLQGLDDERVYLQQRGERTRFRSADLALSSIQSRQRLSDATRYFQSLDDAAEDYSDAQRRVNTLSARHERILQEGIEVAEDADDIERRIVNNRELEARARYRMSRRGGREDPGAVAGSLGVPYSSSIDPRPNQRGLLDPRTGQQVAQGPLTAAETLAAQTAAAGSVSRAQSARLRAARIASSVGIEGAILGAFGLYEFTRFVNDKQREADAELKRLQNLPRTVKDAADLRRQAEEALGPPSSLERVFTRRAAAAGVPAPKAATEALAQADRLERLQSQGRAFTLAQTQAQLKEDLASAGGDEKAARDALARAQRQALSARGLLFAKTPEQKSAAEEAIRVFLEQVIRPRRAALASYAATFDQLLDEATDPTQLAELLSGVNTRTAIRGSSRKLAGQAGQIAARARALLGTTTDPAVEAQLVELSEQAEQTAMNAAQQRLQTALTLATGPRSSGAARRRYIQEARAVLITPFRRDVEGLRENIEDRRQRIERRREEIEQTRQRLEQAQQAPAFAPLAAVGGAINPLLPTAPATAAQGRRRRFIQAMRAANHEDKEKVKELLDALNLNRAQFNALVRETQQAQAQERLERFDARTDRLQSEAATDQDGARILSQRLRERVDIVRALVRKKILTTADLDRAIAESNNAEKAAAEELQSRALDILRARQALTTARLGASGASEESLLRKAISDAQQIASKTPQNANEGIDYLQAQTEIANAEKALNEYLRQQAQDLISARAELAASRTTNPVTQAVIQLRRDQQLLRYARTPAERIRLQAQINNDRRSVSTARTEQAADDIQFQLDMDRIDSATAARRFRALARSVKNNKQLKRDLLRRAKALSGEDSSELELTPGNVRLPTLTEIRRYRQQYGPRVSGATARTELRGEVVSHTEGIGRGARIDRRTSIVNRNQLTVIVQKGSEDKVYDALEKVLGDVKVAARARRPG